jgi:site-specific DNA-methyltransferase (adenine-specific)
MRINQHEEHEVKPYYDEGGITIYHGDCREVLPTLGKVDAVFADPPYGVDIEYGESFDDTPEYVDQLVLEVLPTLRSMARIVAVTPGTVNIWRYPPTPSVLAWAHTVNVSDRRKNPVARLMKQRSWQPILVYGDRFAVLRADLYAAPTVRDTANHPCPKPMHFARWIVQRISDGSETVLDPFMGSGTTLRAAKDLGRRAIGIEIEEKYCEIAATRLGQGVLDFGGAA